MVDSLPSRAHRQLHRCLQKLGLPEPIEVNWQRLDRALTHDSADAEDNYEQLELLGDAVLRLAATEYLQSAFPQATVGEISALRSVLTSDRTLAQLAAELGLDRYLLTARGLARPESVSPALLADSFEAILAVLYLENHNLDLIRPWLDPHLQRLTHRLQQDPARQNYKDALQVLTQAHDRTRPEYRTVEVAPRDNQARRYRSEVWFRGACWGVGRGPTKKLAEQAAAAEAWGKLQPLGRSSAQP
ncbi:MAG: ribonuclease III [Cyanobacteria bacterium REEB459]|nr:ribonuclease III [Cyanobacteria bacterium REEB459]